MIRRKQNARAAGSKKASVHGELRSGPIAGTALIDGATFSQKPVLYAEIDGQAIFEGDIVLGTVQSLKQAQGQDLPLRSIGITGQQFRWPNATIPYEIDPTLPNQQRVTDAIAHWEAHTRIRFVAPHRGQSISVSGFRSLCARRRLLVDGRATGWTAKRHARSQLHVWKRNPRDRSFRGLVARAKPRRSR